MTRRTSPTLRRKQLASRIQALLDKSGMSAAQADAKLGWNKGKLSRYTRGDANRPSLRDMADLLDLFQVADQRARDEIVELARHARERDWWHPYREMLSPDYTTYMGLEAGAQSVYAFEPLIFHGLVQTPDYAHAIMTDGPEELDPDIIEKRLEIRLQRQELLTGPDPLRFRGIFDEAVLHRRVGGRAVLQKQLQHVLELAQLPRVTFQVLPFAAGAHAGVRGPFAILEFPEEGDSPAAYVETHAGELLIEKPKVVAPFQLALTHLQGQALGPKDSLALIAATAAEV
jgi:hypothetical protein